MTTTPTSTDRSATIGEQVIDLQLLVADGLLTAEQATRIQARVCAAVASAPFGNAPRAQRYTWTEDDIKWVVKEGAPTPATPVSCVNWNS